MSLSTERSCKSRTKRKTLLSRPGKTLLRGSFRRANGNAASGAARPHQRLDLAEACEFIAPIVTYDTGHQPLLLALDEVGKLHTTRAMASLRNTAAARLLRSASQTRSILPATRRFESSVPAKKEDVTPARPQNAPDYDVHFDKATSYELRQLVGAQLSHC